MNILSYLQQVRAELTKVTWPTGKAARELTTVILVVSLAVGLYVGGLDLLFTNLLGTFLQ